MGRWTLILLFTLVVGPAAGQDTAVITGRVTSAETGEPLPGAHVFIASSMQGSATTRRGTYRIEAVRPGAHRIHFSMLGYLSENVDTLLHEPGTYEIHIELEETVLETEEVVVEGERNRRWERRYERFVREFIGETENAAETEILNPEVLSFSSRWGVFRAEALEPLVIENRALGYRLTYHLEDFSSTGRRVRYDGDPFFEELVPEDSAEARAWERRREEAYYGSFRHFLRAAVEGTLEEEGFRVYRRPRDDLHTSLAGTPYNRPRPARERHFIREGEELNEYRLQFRGYLEILYTEAAEPEGYVEWARERRRPADFQQAQISLRRGAAVFDEYGTLLDPYSVTGYLYYAYTRVADALPTEYWPEEIEGRK